MYHSNRVRPYWPHIATLLMQHFYAIPGVLELMLSDQRALLNIILDCALVSGTHSLPVPLSS